MTRTLALLALLGLAACETVEGAGRDLTTAGEASTEEAQETQAGMYAESRRFGDAGREEGRRPRLAGSDPRCSGRAGRAGSGPQPWRVM